MQEVKETNEGIRSHRMLREVKKTNGVVRTDTMMIVEGGQEDKWGSKDRLDDDC